MKKVIGLCGFIGAGKDTVANYLVREHGFTKMAFAGALKDAAAAIFGWDRALLEGDTKESREWREAIDIYWTQKLGRTITPRKVLQELGTEVFRQSFSESTWVFALDRRIELCDTNVVITDVRFPNEIRAIKAHAGTVLEINRSKPEWYEAVYWTNRSRGSIPPGFINAHPSEYSWVGFTDITIENRSSIQDLENNVKQALDL